MTGFPRTGLQDSLDWLRPPLSVLRIPDVLSTTLPFPNLRPILGKVSAGGDRPATFENALQRAQRSLDERLGDEAGIDSAVQ
jgi:hypothetical protein